ncbi:MAG: radical SAM protein [Candidatus Omnitrophica bacterium]|nr:radical SAM protein [Candidatus Omnitrophota bacterium]
MEPKARFTWNMLYDCNYRCSYCFFEGKWEKYRAKTVYLSPEEWEWRWKRVSDKYGPPYLVITGGEPFIYPNFIEIIKRLMPICSHIDISTNSSGDLERFTEIIDPRPLKVSLALSYHPQFDNLEEFMQKLLFVRGRGFKGCVNLVAYPPFLKDIEHYKEKFASAGRILNIIPFFGEYKGVVYPPGYTQDERRLLGINDEWFKKVRKKGSVCSAGHRAALIFPDGKMARCGQLGEDNALGNFLDPNFKLMEDTIPCEAEFCPCAEGDIIPEEDRNDTGEKLIREQKKDSPSQAPIAKKGIYFTWDIHYKCNFRCPYCWFYKGWIDGGKRNIYLAPEEWFKHWKRIYDKYGQIHIEITGGEPFLYPDFIKIVEQLSRIHTIKITTNMSGDIETFVKKIDPNRVHLDLNFHPLFSEIGAFIKKTLLLKEAGFRAGVCYLAYPPQMKQIGSFKKRFEEAGINFALAAFWGEYAGKKYPDSYTQEEMDLIRPFLGDIDRIVYHLKGGSPKGKLCNAGHKYAVVQADGNIIRCGQLADKFIGSIFDEGLQLFNKPSPCEAQVCPCNEYINIVDEKDNLPEIKSPPDYRRGIAPHRVYFNWDITHECNYACSYCMFHGTGRKKEIVPTIYPGIDKLVEIWRGIYEKYGSCEILFSGGEPFVYPGFMDFIERLSRIHTLEFSTNFSWDPDDFINRIKPGRARIAASFHPEFTDFDTFFSKVLRIRKAGFEIWVNYVTYPPFLKNMSAFQEKFENSGITFSILPFGGDYGGKVYPEGYTQEELNYLNSLGTRVHVKETLDFAFNITKRNTRGKLCRMGQMYAKILPNGEATNCCVPGALRLGNIFDNTFSLLEKPFLCEQDNCHCWRCMLVGNEGFWLEHWPVPPDARLPYKQG